MASSFGKYTSGIEASTGNLVAASGQMAALTANTLAGLGQNIADGIKTYAKNQEEADFRTSKAQGIGGTLEFYAKQIKDNPELAPFAESFNPIIKKMGNFASMSRGQQLGALAEAEFFQASIAPSLALFKEGNVSRTRQGVQSALAVAPTITTKSGYTIDGLPYQPLQTPEWNFDNNRKHFELAKQNNKNLTDFDVESGLGKLANAWTDGFASDPNLAKNDPKFRDTILYGIENWKKLNSGTPIESESDYVQATISAQTAPADIKRQEVAAEALAAQRETSNIKLNRLETQLKTSKEKAVELYTRLVNERKDGKDGTADWKKGEVELNKMIELNKALTTQIESIKNPDDTSSPDKTLLTKAAAALTAKDTVEATADRVVAQETKKTYEELLKSIQSGSYIGILDRLEQGPNGKLLRNIQGNKELIEAVKQNDPEGRFRHDDLASPNLSRGSTGIKSDSASEYIYNKADEARKDLFAKIGELRGTQDLGLTEGGKDIGAVKKLAMEQKIKSYIENLDKTIAGQVAIKPTTPEEAASKAQGIAKIEPTPEEVKAKAEAIRLNESYGQPFDFGTRIQEGTETTVRNMNTSEEKESVRKWFMENRGGIIPEALDAVYRSIRPESDVQMIDAGDGGRIMITSKGAQYIPPVKTTEMTDKQKSEKGLYNYGVRDSTGTRLIPVERTPKSGIKLAGFATGGEDNAKAFLKLHDDTVKGREIIPQLLKMYKKDKLGRTLIPDKDWGVAESLLAQLKAAIRVETVGTGPVAIAEHKSILERIGDPRQFFQFDTVGKGKLESIMTSMEKSLINNNAGITVIIAPQAEDAEAIEREARTAANKRKR